MRLKFSMNVTRRKGCLHHPQSNKRNKYIITHFQFDADTVKNMVHAIVTSYNA